LIALLLTDPFDTLTYENLAPVAASGLMKSKLRSLLLLLTRWHQKVSTENVSTKTYIGSPQNIF